LVFHRFICYFICTDSFIMVPVGTGRLYGVGFQDHRADTRAHPKGDSTFALGRAGHDNRFFTDIRVFIVNGSTQLYIGNVSTAGVKIHV
jgi:hypothetical protein